MFKLYKLFNPEKHGGFTHYGDIDYTMLTGFDALTGVVDLVAAVAGYRVRDAAYKLLEEFDGGATSATTLELGFDLAAGSDDPDGYMSAKSVHADATPIAYGVGDGAALAAAGGHVFLESGTIEALFTAVGANLSVLTQGRVRVLLNLVDLNKIVREYVAD